MTTTVEKHNFQIEDFDKLEKLGVGECIEMKLKTQEGELFIANVCRTSKDLWKAEWNVGDERAEITIRRYKKED